MLKFKADPQEYIENDHSFKRTSLVFWSNIRVVWLVGIFTLLFLLIPNATNSQSSSKLPDAEWLEMTYSYVGPIPVDFMNLNDSDKQDWVNILIEEFQLTSASVSIELLIFLTGAKLAAKIFGVFTAILFAIPSVGYNSPVTDFILMGDNGCADSRAIVDKKYTAMYVYNGGTDPFLTSTFILEKKVNSTGFFSQWENVEEYKFLTENEKNNLESSWKYFNAYILKTSFTIKEPGTYRVDNTVFEVELDTENPRIIEYHADSKVDGNIYVTFNEDMRPSSFSDSNISIKGSKSGYVNCTYSFDPYSYILTINPIKDFMNDENISVTIQNGVKDIAGNPLATPYSFNFQITKSQSFIINAYADHNGEISPHGNLTFSQGNRIDFSSNPFVGYEVNSWFLDGELTQSGGNTFKLENLQSSHSIYVTFKPISNGHINIISPNGGETLFRGRNSYITWNIEGETGDKVKIELYRSGILIKTIEEETLNDGSYKWEISENEIEGSGYRIRISSIAGSNSDKSDEPFEISSWVNRNIIEIRTAEELEKISTGGLFPRNSYYLLMNDIDVSNIENFKPIGSDYEHYFRGTFDGQGFTISNLNINRSSESYIGLFSVLMNNGIIKNLYLRDNGIYGKSSVGSLVGECAGTLINCHIIIDDVEGKGGSKIGGLVGENTQTGCIKNCSVKCIEGGDIEAEGNSPNHIGGIAGENAGLIKWCSTEGTIDAQSSSKGINGDEIGGLAGTNYGVIEESYSACRWIDGDDWVGGLVGLQVSGKITNCYFMGDKIDNDNGGGGIAGKAEGGVIDCCYVSGKVGTKSDIGMLIGKNSITISNSFWNSDTGGINNAIGDNNGTVVNCHSLSSIEMNQESSFTSKYNTNWDFHKIWVITNDTNYPQLKGIGNKLNAPEAIIASKNQSDGIHLSWSHVTSSISSNSYNAVYSLYRSDSPELDSEKTKLSDFQQGNTFIDLSATPEETYYYWIKSFATTSGARESEYSNAVEGFRIFPVLNAPANISASDGLSNSVTIEWNEVTNAHYYRLYRANSINGQKVIITDWQNKLSYTDIPPSKDLEYYYWVKAASDKTGKGSSDFSDPDIGYYIVPDIPKISLSITPESCIEKQELAIQAVAEDGDFLDKIILHWKNKNDNLKQWNNIGTKTYNFNYIIGSFSEGDSIKYWAEVWDKLGLYFKSETSLAVVNKKEISAPSRPNGISDLNTDSLVQYWCVGVSSNNNADIEYRFSWGDGTFSGWGSSTRNHSWNSEGQYFIKAQARLVNEPLNLSPYSASLAVNVTKAISTYSNNINLLENNISLIPNPFQRKLNIQLNLISDQFIKVNIFSIDGKFVTSIEKIGKQGLNNVVWYAMDSKGHLCNPGVYLINVILNGSYVTKKVILTSISVN